MARIRTIKPEFWADEKLGPLVAIDRLVFLGLISLADDCGRLLDNVKQIDAALFPYTDESARDSLMRLADLGRIVRGETTSRQKVIQVKNWHHQKIERPNLGGALPPIVGHEEGDERTAYLKRKAVPKWMREAVFERDKHTCQQCGKENLRTNKVDRYDSGPDLGEVDHKTEAIDGGRPDMENLVLLCLPCNRKKSGLERRRRNEERAANDLRRVADDSANVQRTFSDESSPRPTTYDQRSTITDQRPMGTRKRAAPKAEKAWPHFPDEARARVLQQFRKIGEFPAGQIINAVGPYFRPADAPEFVPHDMVLLAVEDYCGLATRGRSAPFAGPADLAKKLGALIRNCQNASRFDPVARVDAQMIAIHGSAKVAA